MDTPSYKRPFSNLSPSVDSEFHPEKKTCSGQVSDSTEILQNSMLSGGDGEKFEEEDVPKWAKTLLVKITETHNIVVSLETRLRNLESLANEAKMEALEAKQLASQSLDVASGSRDLAKEGRDHAAELEQKLEDVERDNHALRQQIQHVNDYSRRNNLIVEGLEDRQNETDDMVMEKVRSFIKDNLHINDADAIRFDRCHRLGRYNNERRRAVVIRFNWYFDRIRVWNSRKKLKGSRLFLKEDFSPATKEAREKLYPYFRAAMSGGNRAVQMGEKLRVNGTLYSVDDIGALEMIVGKQEGGSEGREQRRRRRWKNNSHTVAESPESPESPEANVAVDIPEDVPNVAENPSGDHT